MALVAKRIKAKDKVITSQRTLAQILEGLRSQGKTVVLVAGCFDLLHAGHVRCLEDAKSRGDFLVAAVYDDRNAGKIKGRGFPINELEERMETLAGLASVDYVTPCEDADASLLIERLAPTHFAKGSDQTEASVAERQALKATQTRVLVCGDKKTRSATKIVQKIRKRKFE